LTEPSAGPDNRKRMAMEILQPRGWKKPSGYSNGIKAEGRMIFVAGQVGWDEEQRFTSDELTGQVRQALENIVTVLREGNAKPEHIVRMTWYVTDIKNYRSSTREIGTIYRDVIGNHYPAMTLIEVADLVDEGARVEIEVTAVVPRTA
jgi:enamine deaminase RidA (YjgF/YER057c/UK114 family)